MHWPSDWQSQALNAQHTHYYIYVRQCYNLQRNRYYSTRPPKAWQIMTAWLKQNLRC